MFIRNKNLQWWVDHIRELHNVQHPPRKIWIRFWFGKIHCLFHVEYNKERTFLLQSQCKKMWHYNKTIVTDKQNLFKSCVEPKNPACPYSHLNQSPINFRVFNNYFMTALIARWAFSSNAKVAVISPKFLRTVRVIQLIKCYIVGTCVFYVIGIEYAQKWLPVVKHSVPKIITDAGILIAPSMIIYSHQLGRANIYNPPNTPTFHLLQPSVTPFKRYNESLKIVPAHKFSMNAVN